MAWEETKRQGRTIMTGDKPIDEMALTLKKLAKAYQDRFDRKPSLAEILYAVETVINSATGLYVSDVDEINTQNVFAKND